ncbi:MAG TPA: hypothetical protein VEL47_04110 [Myxococcota bacterium]|nr:hypothetical protein [Myxococcota bacterium]
MTWPRKIFDIWSKVLNFEPKDEVFGMRLRKFGVYGHLSKQHIKASVQDQEIYPLFLDGVKHSRREDSTATWTFVKPWLEKIARN